MFNFLKDYSTTISNFGQLGTILIALFTVFLWREAIFTRLGTIKPILIPYRTETLQTSDRLFVYNFGYPITNDSFNHFGIAFLGIRNIGKGPACEVRVELFKKSNGQEFYISENSINIAENSTIPLIIRIGYKDHIEDLENATYVTKISYTDILRKKYYFELELWLRDITEKEEIIEAVAIRYKNSRQPNWRKFDTVTFREIEHLGYWELLKIRDNFDKREKESLQRFN